MVEIAHFGVEAWLNKWEKSATYDISQSTIASLSMHDLLNLDGNNGEEFYEMLDKQQMNYGWIEGSPEFKKKLLNYITMLIRKISCKQMVPQEQIF